MNDSDNIVNHNSNDDNSNDNSNSNNSNNDSRCVRGAAALATAGAAAYGLLRVHLDEVFLLLTFSTSYVYVFFLNENLGITIEHVCEVGALSFVIFVAYSASYWNRFKVERAPLEAAQELHKFAAYPGTGANKIGHTTV